MDCKKHINQNIMSILIRILQFYKNLNIKTFEVIPKKREKLIDELIDFMTLYVK